MVELDACFECFVPDWDNYGLLPLGLASLGSITTL